MDRQVMLVAPDGSSLDAEIIGVQHEDDGVVATFRLARAGWDQVRSAGLLHVVPERLLEGEELLDGSDAIEVEAALDPDVELSDADRRADGLPGVALATESWWALNATREVPLPAALAETGSLREGVALTPPPWMFEGDLVAAWRAVAPPMEQDEAVADEPMLSLIQGMLEDQGWELERPDPKVTILSAPVSTDDGDHMLWIRTSEEQYLVTVYSVLDIEVPSERIGAMLELAGYLNKQVYVGSFEVDPDSGAFSFKNGMDTEGSTFTISLARQLVGHALVGAEKSLPLALAVAEGRFEPAHAASHF